MTSTEIWLRLISIGDLYGDKMVAIAQQLQRETHIDDAVLAGMGLTQKQKTRFFSFSPREIERSMQWLAEPGHHLICADSVLYPAQLRAIVD